MSKKERTASVPKLRFPEFQNYGAINFKNGNRIFEPISDKNHNSDLPVLAITQEHGAIPRELIDYKVSVTDKSIESYKVVEKGDFIISLRSFQGGIEYSMFHGICSPAYIILRKKVPVVEIYYKHYFKTSKFIKELNRNIEGLRDGKMVSYSQFSSLLLPMPDVKEQQKIADCLTSIDDLVTAEEKKLKELKDYKNGLMQNLFPAEGETLPEWRFPEFRNTEEWSIHEFGELIQPIEERAGKRKFTLMSVTSGIGLVPQIEKFGKEIAGSAYKNYYVIKKCDFAYNRSATKQFPEGYISMLTKYEEAAVPNSIFTCFRIIDKDCYPNFFDHLFHANYHGLWLRKFIAIGARAHGSLNIDTKYLWNMPIVLPKFQEQQKIADCLSLLDDVVTAQAQKIEALKTHKKGLMQGLFPSFGEVGV